MDGNVIVGQSGGPTSVINSSLAGVYKTAIDRGAKKVYGMLHGIKGLLDRQYVDLSEKIGSTMDIDLLKRTPSSYLGSCRYKLPDINEDKETFDKIFKILDELEITATIITARGAYSNSPRELLMIAVRKQMYPKLEEIVKDEDVSAFMIVSSANEIYGEGYKDITKEKI